MKNHLLKWSFVLNDYKNEFKRYNDLNTFSKANYAKNNYNNNNIKLKIKLNSRIVVDQLYDPTFSNNAIPRALHI